jgi:hypothetical protein
MADDLELYSYFMVRVRHPSAGDPRGPAACTGLVERLDTGEKRAFGSADELQRLLVSWRPGRTSIPVDPAPEQPEPPVAAPPEP